MDIGEGRIVWVSGPAVKASITASTRMHSVAMVGEDGLLGEVIEIEGGLATIQVYEDTIGLKPGEKVVFTAMPLTVELGPGLLGNIFDGIERPLKALRCATGDFVRRGSHIGSRLGERGWEFNPVTKRGDIVKEGDIIGVVKEDCGREHRIMLPIGNGGKVVDVRKGSIPIDEPVITLEGGIEINMLHRWPIRKPRPYLKKLPPSTPFITGQRVIDTFFHVAEGGTAVIPGGFGTGKTVTEQTLAKYGMADIIIYIGCGERGNEMSELLREFPHLKDPETGMPLLSRTIFIVNTSNMPVAAREASIYTGITIAEYFRDMGYHVALFADSTSRWAEALREISSRMEELPGEEGYPSYLASRLGEFYERSGRVMALGSPEREGSVTIVGAVSPPGGDFSEPVTQVSLRFGGAFWALDTDLAYRRHFPSINWMRSYTLYTEQLSEWFSANISEDWHALRDEALLLLHRVDELQEIVRLIGPDALQDRDRVTLETGRILTEGFLKQNAFNEQDAFCPPSKQYWMLKAIISFYHKALDALKKGLPIEKIIESKVIEGLIRMFEIPDREIEGSVKAILEGIDKVIGGGS